MGKSLSNRGEIPAADVLEGVWEGEYVCNQGATGLRLTVSAVSDTTVDTTVEATFDFFPLAANPSVPSGSFAMQGTVGDGGLLLDGVRWIVQPDGYLMVGLRAEVPAGEVTELRGTVVGPNCSTFFVRRAP